MQSHNFCHREPLEIVNFFLHCVCYQQTCFFCLTDACHGSLWMLAVSSDDERILHVCPTTSYPHRILREKTHLQFLWAVAVFQPKVRPASEHMTNRRKALAATKCVCHLQLWPEKTRLTKSQMEDGSRQVPRPSIILA